MYENSNTYGRILSMTKSNDYKMLLTLLLKSFYFSEKKNKTKIEIGENMEYLSTLNDVIKEVCNEFKGTERGIFLNEQLKDIDKELAKEREVLNAS